MKCFRHKKYYSVINGLWSPRKRYIPNKLENYGVFASHLILTWGLPGAKKNRMVDPFI